MKTEEVVDNQTPGWEPVESSQIDAMQYIPEMSVLFLRFKGGAEYRYDGISPEVNARFRASESKGTFFGRYIKPVYPAVKISDAKPQATEMVPAREPVKIELSELEKEVQGLVDYAKALPVTCKEEAETAISFIRQRKSVLDTFVEWFAPIKKASWDAHKKNTEKEKSIIDPNQAAIDIVKSKLKAFDDEQERIAREERERIRREEEAKERARREREEAERKERQRIEDEKRAIEDARLKAEREKLEAEKKAQAEALAKAGKVQEAERVAKLAAAQAQLDAIMAEHRRVEAETARLAAEQEALERMSAPIEVFIPETKPEHVDGQTKAYAWKAEVTDIRTLCRGIAEGKTPPDVISVNQRRLDSLAKTWKARTSEYHPGIKGVEDKSIRIK